jgi:hypothetical protein
MAEQNGLQLHNHSWMQCWVRRSFRESKSVLHHALKGMFGWAWEMHTRNCSYQCQEVSLMEAAEERVSAAYCHTYDANKQISVPVWTAAKMGL